MPKNNALVIGYRIAFPNRTSSVRLRKLAFEMTKLYNVDVITYHGQTNDWDIGAEIHTIPVFSFTNSVRAKNQVSEESKKTWIIKTLIKLAKSFPTNLFLGEANIFYIIKAYRTAVTIINAKKTTVILSSYSPYGDHYVAYLLKLKFPHLKWIADFRDLYIEPVYDDVLFKSLQRWKEKKVLAKADLVTTISDGYSKILSKYNIPVKTITRGVETRPTLEKFEKFTICYTGSLFQDYRDPRFLFTNLKELLDDKQLDANNVELIYAGKDSDLFSQWVKSFGLIYVYKDLGLVSRDQAKELQSRSHLNLLLTSSTSEWQGVLTGKLFEYLESGNPTICLVKGVHDQELESFFENFNAGIVCYDKSENTMLKEFLTDCFHSYKNGESIGDLNKSKLSEISWYNITKSMFNEYS